MSTFPYCTYNVFSYNWIIKTNYCVMYNISRLHNIIMLLHFLSVFCWICEEEMADKVSFLIIYSLTHVTELQRSCTKSYLLQNNNCLLWIWNSIEYHKVHLRILEVLYCILELRVKILSRPRSASLTYFFQV